MSYSFDLITRINNEAETYAQLVYQVAHRSLYRLKKQNKPVRIDNVIFNLWNEQYDPNYWNIVHYGFRYENDPWNVRNRNIYNSEMLIGFQRAQLYLKQESIILLDISDFSKSNNIIIVIAREDMTINGAGDLWHGFGQLPDQSRMLNKSNVVNNDDNKEQNIWRDIDNKHNDYCNTVIEIVKKKAEHLKDKPVRIELSIINKMTPQLFELLHYGKIKNNNYFNRDNKLFIKNNSELGFMRARRIADELGLDLRDISNPRISNNIVIVLAKKGVKINGSGNFWHGFGSDLISNQNLENNDEQN
jgi:hypothetical protein